MTQIFLKRTTLVVFAALSLVLVPAALILAPGSLRAQTLTSGDIAGTVMDSSGAVVPNAKVKATNTGTGAAKEVVSDAAGNYRISLLQPGSYTVTVTSPGFQSQQFNLVIAVGQIANQNFKLEIAQGVQTVEVMGAEVPLLQTDTSEMSTTITQEQVQNLPNPGGDVTYPINVTQGVVMNTQGGYGNAEAFGLPATSNNYTVNGAEDNDPFLNLNNSGPSNLLLGSNDVDQVNVVANAYGAEYGALGGVQENILTRSGTNRFHGNVVYYWTNSDLNANQWFNDNTATPESYSNANQGAAAIGGPIVKDKAFFFVNYETLRFLTSVPQQVIVPSPAYQSAVLANLASTGQATQIPFYQQLFAAYNGAPGASRATPYNGTTYADAFEGSARSNLDENLITGRVDWKLGANDSFFAHVKHDQGVQPTHVDPISPLFNTQSNQPDWEGQMQETHTFTPDLINQFIFSTAWYSAIFKNSDPAGAAAFTPYTLSFADGSFTTLGGEMYFFPQGRNVTQYQFNDDVSWTKGKHTAKFGFIFKRDDTTDYDPQILSQFPLATEYGPASSPASDPTAAPLSSGDYFGSGTILNALQAFPQRPTSPIAQYNLGFYAQDQWRYSSNFQITAGVRFEHNSNPVCQVDCFGRFTTSYDRVTAGLDTPYSSVIATGLHQAFNGLQTLAVDPRIGFTFSPRNHSNTVLRGGFGMFTDIFPATVADNLLSNPPFNVQFSASGLSAPSVAGSVSSALVDSNSAFQNAYAAGGSYNSITAVDPGFTQPNIFNTDPNIHYPTYEEYSLQLQQQIGRNTSFQVGYVGNHGYHEPWVNNGVNMYGFGGAPATATLPAFAQVNEIKSAANSNYNGLVISVKNQSKIAVLQFNYTYSHALDEISNGGFLPFGYDSVGQPNTGTIDPFNLASQNYGNADYDIRHNLNGSYLINVPYLGGPHVVTDNWTLGGTLFLHTGFPFSVYDGDVTGSLAPNYGGGEPAGEVLADVVNPGVPHHCGINKSSPTTSCFGSTSTSTSPDFADPTGFGGQTRNQFTGPGYFNTDFTMMKGFKVPRMESGLFQVGVEAYNILNHPNFLNPDSNFSDGPGFGVVTATASAPTSVYGSFLGGNSSARILQLKAQIKF
ncbi:MAG: carboxypeptidase regulatory-like domain-containing protein [Terracidiphilus sp.]